MLGTAPTLFAYPNGDWADAAESALVECGYEVGVLFDHRLTSGRQHHLRLSRLRIDSDEHAKQLHRRDCEYDVELRGGRAEEGRGEESRSADQGQEDRGEELIEEELLEEVISPCV